MEVVPLVALGLALAALIALVVWQPHRGLVVGAVAALAIALLGRAAEPGDLLDAARAQWRAFVTLLAVLLMTSLAEHMGVLARLAQAIEPRTRGPVRRAFRFTFVAAAVVSTLVSNDAAIVIMTPTVITLLRTVYPKRYPKFIAPFAFAIFTAAGIAPLVTSNPMNLIFAEHVGLGFNQYALVMAPLALVSWGITYAALSWCFREVLADEAPALGAWPERPPPLRWPALLVACTWAAVLLAYPVVAYLDGPLWVVGAIGATICVGAGAAAGVRPRAVIGGVPWGLFPFLTCVYVLALGLQRAGAAAALADVYAAGPTVPTIGAISAAGSALFNNHPMSVLSAMALPPGDGTLGAYAALVGGDLGPRLLPMGSLAGLLWLHALRRTGDEVPLRQFVRIGVVTGVPALVGSLALLWLMHR